MQKKSSREKRPLTVYFDSNVEFGKYLRQYRESKGIGLRELARKAGISQAYLSQIERCEPRMPSEAKVLRLAEALGHPSPAELLAKAGQISSEVARVYHRNPEAWSALLLAAVRLTEKEVEFVVRSALTEIEAIPKRQGRPKLKRSNAQRKVAAR